MSIGSGGKCFQCPCCKPCDECSDSKNVLAVLGTNLVIYRQRPNVLLNNNVESIKVKPEDTVILKNIDDKMLNISDCISSQELQDIYCPRCKYIIEHANKMMLKGKINEHLVIGVCSHCRQKSRPLIPCYECEDIAKKVIVRINEGSEDSKQKLKTWLVKVKHLLKDVKGNDEKIDITIPGIKYSEQHTSVKYGPINKNVTVQQTSPKVKEKISKQEKEAQIFKQNLNHIYRTRSVDSDLEKMTIKSGRKDAILKSDVKYDSKSDRTMSRGISDYDSETPLHKRDVSRYDREYGSQFHSDEKVWPKSGRKDAIMKSDVKYDSKSDRTMSRGISDYDSETPLHKRDVSKYDREYGSQFHSDEKFWPKSKGPKSGRLDLSSNYLSDKKYDQKQDDDFHLQLEKQHVSKVGRKNLLKASEFDSDYFSDRRFNNNDELDPKKRRAVREYDDHQQHEQKGLKDFLPPFGSLDKLIHKEYLKTTMPGLKIDEEMEEKKYAKQKQTKFVELSKDKSVIKTPMYRSRSEISIFDDVRTSVHSVPKGGSKLYKDSSKPKKDFIRTHGYNEDLGPPTLQRRKSDTNIDERTTLSYTSQNKKIPLKESFSEQLSKPSEQLLRKDFSYQFPKETIVKKTPKHQRTSAELIKETQEMLNVKEEEKQRKIEMERIKKRHDDEIRKQAREEKRRLQEEKKREQEELKRIEEQERIRAEEEKRRLEEERREEEKKQKALEDIKRKEEEKLSPRDDKKKKGQDQSKIKDQNEEDKQRAKILEKERAKEEKERVKEEKERAKEEKERKRVEKEVEKAEKEKEKAEREKEKQDKKKAGDEKRHTKENTKDQPEKPDKEKVDKEAEKLKKEKEKEIQLRMQREEKLREKDEKDRLKKELREEKEQKKKEEEGNKKQIAEEQKNRGNDEKTSGKVEQKDKTDKKKKEIKKPEKFEEKAAKVDSAKEPVIKELNLKQIKILKPSYDDLILRLVRLKQTEPKGTTKLEQIELPQIARQHKKHKYLKGPSCLMCCDSEFELDVESIILKPNQAEPKFADIIIGQKILKYKPPLTEKVEQAGVPSLFQSTFKVESPTGIKNKVDFSNVEPEHISTIAEPPKSHKSAETEAPKGVIRYALSDRSFIDKGWTMLPTEKIVRKMNVYRMRPAHPEFDWFERNKNKKLMLYDTGEKLAEFDDNGRARIYYKNGRLALDYYDAEEVNAQQRFVVFSSGELDERGRSHPITILATFDYLGNGIVFDYGGKIRLKYNQTEGVVLDRGIGPVSHWKWHTLNDPPVLQKVMIDTQMAHKDPDIVKLGTLADDKSRPDNEEMLAIEFDNFIKEKSKKLTQTFKPFQIKMKALKINEHFSLKILDQATIYLIFRDSSANIKLNLGMILDHKEIVDTDTAEVGEVSNNLERFPARTDSLAGLQRSVAYAQRFERARLERERHLRPPEPCSSADQLTAAASRPLRPPFRTVPSAPTTTAGSCICSRKPRSCNVYYDTRLI